MIHQTQRLHHLDSLRGIAALMVALCHSFASWWVSLHQLPWNYLGPSPVVFFFLLSGYVLSGSLLKNGNINTKTVPPYFVRRFFRLYPAVVAALCLTLALSFIYQSYPVWGDGAESYWVSNSKKVIGFMDYSQAFLLLGPCNLIAPLWTIRVEIVCSLILPLLLLLMKRCIWLELATAFILGTLLFIEQRAKGSHLDVLLGYLFPFFLGYLIQRLSPWLNLLSRGATKFYLFLTLILWSVSLRGDQFRTTTASLELALLLAFLVPCNWPALKDVLLTKPLRFLGKVSYSFYLIHMPILLLLCQVSGPWVHPSASAPLKNRIVMSLIYFAVSVAVSLPIAALMERWVEQPFNNLGHRLAKKWFSASQ